MILTYLVVRMYFSLSHIFFRMKLFVFQYLFYLYFTHFKELLSSILNFLNFFGENGTPTNSLKIFNNVPVVIAYNFEKQNYCKLSRQFIRSVVFVQILGQKRPVHQLNTKVILKKVVFILANVLEMILRSNFKRYLNSALK